MLPHQPRIVVLEEVLAWRTALSGWLWVCFCLAAGLIRGLVASQQDTLAPVALSSPLLLVLTLFLGAMLGGLWTRFQQIASLGYLNFMISRLGWLIVSTVLGAALWAGPSGAFGVLMKTLTALPQSSEAARTLVMGRLVMGQGWIVLAALPWLSYMRWP